MAVDVKEQLSRLIYLQEHDLRLHKITEQIAAIPVRRAEVTVEVDAIKTEMTILAGTRTAQEAERRDLEGEVAVAAEHLKTFESKLHSIRTNKEYQAALKEIAEIKKSNKEKDDRVLQLMEAIDAATQKLTQLSAGLADKESQVASAVEALKQEEAATEADRVTCEGELRQAEAQVAPEVMRIYQMVRGKYIDALSPVEAAICGGCRMRVPPQLQIELHRAVRLCQCPNCQRILFMSESKSSP